MVNYWVKEIFEAKKFNEWYLKLQKNRYDESIKKEMVEKYDFLIDTIISMNLPECDLDFYNI